MAEQRRDYFGFLNNCLFIGESCHTLSDGKKVRNTLEIRVPGYKFTLMGAIDLLDFQNWTKNLNGRSLVTTKVDIEADEEVTRDDAEEALFGLADLLSFATSSEVKTDAHPEWDHSSAQSKLPFTINTRHRGIDSPFGTDLKRFVEFTWERYWKYRDYRRLNITAGIYSRCFRDAEVREVPFLLCVVLLEHLKSTWALQAGYPFKKHFFKYPQGHPRVGERAVFAKLIQEMPSK